MADSYSFLVPANKTVYIQGFTSAVYSQQATIDGGGANNILLTGQGAGRTTPAIDSFTSNGGQVTVTIQHDPGSGWVGSEVRGSVETDLPETGENVVVFVTSEDEGGSGDGDFNDCVVVFYYTTHDNP